MGCLSNNMNHIAVCINGEWMWGWGCYLYLFKCSLKYRYWNKCLGKWKMLYTRTAECRLRSCPSCVFIVSCVSKGKKSTTVSNICLPVLHQPRTVSFEHVYLDDYFFSCSLCHPPSGFFFSGIMRPPAEIADPEERRWMPCKNTNHHLLIKERDGRSEGGGFFQHHPFFQSFKCPSDLTRREYRNRASLWNLPQCC